MSDDLSGDMLAPSWPNLVFLCYKGGETSVLFVLFLSYRGAETSVVQSFKDLMVTEEKLSVKTQSQPSGQRKLLAASTEAKEDLSLR